ncbi:AbrB/MazE/SpoVT family DNA-binding domain-containing protein [Sphingopyxis soli]|uniref:AbrB/MazE/SpoVT family DNA-binding domain-containing protein n=1 Tax=Sphingopyxis soli TaxID=592051 RepID=UPI001BFE120F|nr:AbrB/MazE/SpoVT family DNA-binding domain-containing protein [Sphingopyxis soli]
MTGETIMKSRGRVLLPPDVLDRMGWSGGTALEIQEMSDGVLLRSRSPSRLTRNMNGGRSRPVRGNAAGRD